jgi:hypothetical protein
MNSRFLIVGVIVLVVFGTFLFSGKKKEENVVQGTQSQVSAKNEQDPEVFESQSKNMGAVEVEITPVSLDPTSNMVFDVALNTHSVDLSYDYTVIISAEDDRGDIYKAINWSGGEGGHHLSGQIELEPLSQKASKITLIIDGIDNVKEKFEWDVK